MLHSIISLTTELKAVHLNLVILICIGCHVCMSHLCVLDDRTSEDLFIKSRIRSSFPWLWSEPRLARGGAAGARCGRQVARPARSHGAEPHTAPGAACGAPCCLPRSALPAGHCAHGRELWRWLLLEWLLRHRLSTYPSRPCLCLPNALRIFPC